jgi:hypothetical protein
MDVQLERPDVALASKDELADLRTGQSSLPSCAEELPAVP